MSFETVVTISAITEIIVISAICLTLINAFSHGALAGLVFRQKQQPAVTDSAGGADHNEGSSYRRAA